MASERINPEKYDEDLPLSALALEKLTRDDLKVNVDRLLELVDRHPVIKVPLEDLRFNLDYKVWTDHNDDRVTPREVINVMKAHSPEDQKKYFPNLTEHIRRIEEADITYPVIEYDGHIMDGRHRIAAAVYRYETGESSQDFLTLKELLSIPEAAILPSED